MLPIQTLCKDCVFQLKENGKQIDCQLDMLSNLHNNGATVVQYEEEDFFVVENRLCVCKRDMQWMGDDDPIEKLQQELKVNYSLLVLVDTLDKLDETCQNIASLNISPQYVYFIHSNINIRLSSIKPLFKKYNPDINMAVNFINDKKLDMSQILNLTARKIKTQFMCCMKIGQALHPNYINKIEQLLFVDWNRILYITGDNNHGDFCYTTVAKTLSLPKIIQLAEEQKCQYLIQKASTIFPDYQQLA